MRSRLVTVAGLLAAALAFGACGASSKSDGNEPGGTAPTAPTSALSPIKVCELVSNRQIAEAGGSGSGTPFVRSPRVGTQWDSCSWGKEVTPPLITIHVEQTAPDAPFAPLQTMVEALATAKLRTVTPVEVGKDGKLYNVALLAVAGDVGQMIVFRAPKGELVVVSATGPTVDVPKLTALAKQINLELA